MKSRFGHFYWLVFLLIIGFNLEQSLAKTVVIGVSGGDKDDKIDQWREDNVDGFCNGVKKSDSQADCRKANTKKGFLDELKKAANELKCGDELVIYYNGHGKKKEFRFVRARKREDKELRAQEILDALKDLECCVKVYVVIHACHSGSLIEELAKDPHIIAVYTCCAAHQKDVKDMQWIRDPKTRRYGWTPRGEDWPTGFEEGLKGHPRGTPLDKALDEASKAARKKTKEAFRDITTPQTWKREEVKIIGHVEEKVDLKQRLVTVHIWQPSSMHCQTRKIEIREGATIPEGLTDCNWIECTVVPIPVREDRDRVYLHGQMTETGAPTIEIKGHVEKVRTDGVKVHIWEPDYLRCKEKEIKLKEGAKLPDDLAECNWVTVTATVTDPDKIEKYIREADVTTAAAPTTEIWGHVRRVRDWRNKKEVLVHVREPAVWRCEFRWIKLDSVPEGLKKCNWIKVPISITDPNPASYKPTGTARADDVQIVSPPRIELYGHVIEVVRKGRKPYVRVKVKSPPDMKGRKIKIYTRDIPAWVQYCEWITVTVGLTNPANGVAELPPGGTFGQAARRRFHAYVKDVDPHGEWIYAHIRQPTSMKGESRVITYDKAFPAGLEAGNMIVANVTSAGVTSVGKRKYKTYKAEWVAKANLAPTPDNYAPYIEDGYVVPESGGTLTMFEYFVTYFDEDNDPPVIMSVYIDDEEYRMERLDTANDDYTDGTVFVFRTRLSEGTHTYYFEAYDGLAMTTMPADDDVWSVTVADCLVVLDDFESYTDAVGNRIFETWKDGWGYPIPPNMYYMGNATGSRVGYRVPPFVEQTIVYEGGQSMPFDYDNTGTGGKACYSEAERTFDAPQDWTRDSVKALSLWFTGDPCNTSAAMYVAVEDGMGGTNVVDHADPDAVLTDIWQEWNIDLKELAGVDLTNVRKMYIGVGDRDNPTAGGNGTIYFDQVRLCPARCIPDYRPAADLNDDCVVDYRDLKMMAEEWLNSNGLQVDLYEDNKVDFKDYVVLGDMWLEGPVLWPDTGPAGCFPSYHPHYGDWLAVGRPDCWCCPNHCYGDFDCDEVVGDMELALIAPLISVEHTDPEYLPCLDFNKNREIDDDDWNTVLINHGEELPGDCLTN